MLVLGRNRTILISLSVSHQLSCQASQLITSDKSIVNNKYLNSFYINLYSPSQKYIIVLVHSLSCPNRCYLLIQIHTHECPYVRVPTTGLRTLISNSNKYFRVPEQTIFKDISRRKCVCVYGGFRGNLRESIFMAILGVLLLGVYDESRILRTAEIFFFLRLE